MARILEDNGKARQAEGKAKVVEWKFRLENARKLRGIFFIDTEDLEFKETIKNARKKLETPLEAKHQKYKGRVVLRGDIVKDDPGAYAVFTEQGSSASQMTAAKVMDIISRLPGCEGRAADAVSASAR